MVRTAPLSCSVEQHRSAARKVCRKHGWRIRTFLIDGGAGIIVVWTDREHTDLEQGQAWSRCAPGATTTKLSKRYGGRTSRPSTLSSGTAWRAVRSDCLHDRSIGSHNPGWLTPERVQALMTFCLQVAHAYQPP